MNWGLKLPLLGHSIWSWTWKWALSMFSRCLNCGSIGYWVNTGIKERSYQQTSNLRYSVSDPKIQWHLVHMQPCESDYSIVPNLPLNSEFLPQWYRVKLIYCLSIPRACLVLSRMLSSVPPWTLSSFSRLSLSPTDCVVDFDSSDWNWRATLSVISEPPSDNLSVVLLVLSGVKCSLASGK